MLNRQRQDSAAPDREISEQSPTTGHPSIEQLMLEQGTGPISDVSTLHGDFWPEEESVEEFLRTLREWRGHSHIDPAA